MKVKVRVSSKQKDLAQFTDKLVNILRQYWTLPPELKNDPTTQHLMNQILEASGLPPATLGALTSGVLTPEAPLPPLSEGATRPIKGLARRESVIA